MNTKEYNSFTVDEVFIIFPYELSLKVITYGKASY